MSMMQLFKDLIMLALYMLPVYLLLAFTQGCSSTKTSNDLRFQIWHEGCLSGYESAVYFITKDDTKSVAITNFASQECMKVFTDDSVTQSHI